MRKTPLEKLNERKLGLPSRGITGLVYLILRLAQVGADVSYSYDFCKEDLKGKQVILLADHATREAYKYVLYGYPFVCPNVVVGYQNIFVRGLFGILMKAGVIPKKLYQADPRSVFDMISVLKMGGSLCIFPEGIQSSSGSTHPIFPGTAKLLKKAGVTVVLCKSYGSYLVKPRYKKKENRGHQEFHYEILFTPEDLKAQSTEEIYAGLLARFRYNDFEWNRAHRNSYKGRRGEPLAKGIENILYLCPKCGGEFCLKTEGEHIICTKCQNRVLLNQYYELSPAGQGDYMPYSSVDDWFKVQRKAAAREVRDGFCCEYRCEHYDLHTEKLSFSPYYSCGEGTVTLTPQGIGYRGTRHGKNVDLFFDIKNIPSFVFTPAQDNDLYYDGTYYSFRPLHDRARVVKYMLLAEEAHRLTDKNWNRVSEDVYGEELEKTTL